MCLVVVCILKSRSHSHLSNKNDQKNKRAITNFDKDFLEEAPTVTPTNQERIDAIDQVWVIFFLFSFFSFLQQNTTRPAQEEFVDFSFVNKDFKAFV